MAIDARVPSVTWRNRFDPLAFPARVGRDVASNPAVGGDGAKAVSLVVAWLLSAVAPIPLHRARLQYVLGAVGGYVPAAAASAARAAANAPPGIDAKPRGGLAAARGGGRARWVSPVAGDAPSKGPKADAAGTGREGGASGGEPQQGEACVWRARQQLEKLFEARGAAL